MKNVRPAFCLMAVLCLSLVPYAQGQTVLFSDSFNRITGSGDPNFLPAAPNNFSDWGMNNNAFGGTISQTYFVGPINRTGGANQTTDGEFGTLISGGTMINVDFATSAPNGFSIAFDFNRFHPINPGTGNGFIAIGFGRTMPDDPNTYGGLGAVNGADFAVLFQQSAGGNVGNTQFFQDSTSAATEFLPGTAATGPLDYGNPTIEHSVLITLTPRVAGQYGDADVIDFSVVVDGGASYASSVLGGADFGRLAFSANPSVHRYIDNLIITALEGGGDSADFDGDGDIDGRDFLVWQRADSPSPLSGSDLALWRSQFGGGALAAVVVPEPSCWVLGLAGVGLLFRHVK